MKVICDRGALLDAVNQMSGVVAGRTSPKVQLTCVKLVATKTGAAGRLTLIGTDGEVSLRLSLDRVDVNQPGEALIPADKLRQIVSAEDSDSTLTIESTDDSVEIRGQDARFKVLGYPAGDYPPVPGFPKAESAKTVFTHQAGSLAGLVARTLFATARENSRYAINGVLLKRDGKRLEMVATDGRRLALARASLSNTEKDGHAAMCIVPSKALGTLQKLIGDGDEPVRIAITDNQVFFHLGAADEKSDGRAMMSSNLVEGAFPPYEDVIPKDQDKVASFDRDVMASAVRRAALLTNEESRGVKLSFSAGEKRVQIASRAPEMGEAEITVDLAEFKGEDISLGFNPGFITDALKVIDDPRVSIELKGSNKPGVIKVGSEFLYVVMPVSLQ